MGEDKKASDFGDFCKLYLAFFSLNIFAHRLLLLLPLLLPLALRSRAGAGGHVLPISTIGENPKIPKTLQMATNLVDVLLLVPSLLVFTS